VARVHGRFGLSAAVKLLRGAKDDRLARSGLDGVSTFGVLAEREEEWLVRLLRRLVTAGWVDFAGDDRPVAVLTEAGAAVMRGERPVRLVLPPERGARPSGGARRPAVPEADLDEAGRALMDALRARRLALARAEGVPPYVVAHDRTLRDVARLRPRTREELLAAHGMGPSKADRFGEALLEVVRAHGGAPAGPTG